MTDTSDFIQSAINAGLAAGQPFEINGTPAVLAPQNSRLELLPKHRSAPQRVEQTVELHDCDSFLAYYHDFATGNSAIFCDRQAGRFAAVIDYHPAADTPAWCQHIARFTARKTVEWAAWQQCDSQKMDQVTFAYFIEEHLPDIVEPAGADMLEIALSLRAKTKLQFERGARLDNGQTQITYREEIEGSAGPKGQFRIPESIKIGLRLFEGGDAYEIEAKFRYRIHEGQLSMWYDLVRPHRVHEDAIEQIATKVRESTASVGNFYFGSSGA